MLVKVKALADVEEVVAVEMTGLDGHWCALSVFYGKTPESGK